MNFKIKKQYKKARIGILTTSHGKIKTPNLAFVATHGNIRLLSSKEQLAAKPELIITNTFHLWVNDKIKEIKKKGGIHNWSEWRGPIMTDSGGFQVFSLGWGRTHGVGKIDNHCRVPRQQLSSNVVEITDNGVIFKYDGKKYKLTPEKSIKLQEDISADIIFTFDECTSPLHNFAYNKKSLEKTHKWAVESLAAHKKKNQLLFGIVQGGVYEKLRKQSSKFIGSLDFDGFGIGGSFGEKQMGKVLDWVLSGLPEDKPKHLLGIGKIKDIFTAVEQGIDLFDCVVPTREARHGVLYTMAGKIDYRKKPARRRDEGAKLYNIYKKDKLKAMKLATIHNIKFYKKLFQKIRKEIMKGKSLSDLKKEYRNLI